MYKKLGREVKKRSHRPHPQQQQTHHCEPPRKLQKILPYNKKEIIKIFEEELECNKEVNQWLISDFTARLLDTDGDDFRKEAKNFVQREGEFYHDNYILFLEYIIFKGALHSMDELSHGDGENIQKNISKLLELIKSQFWLNHVATEHIQKETAVFFFYLTRLPPGFPYSRDICKFIVEIKFSKLEEKNNALKDKVAAENYIERYQNQTLYQSKLEKAQLRLDTAKLALERHSSFDFSDWDRIVLEFYIRNHFTDPDFFNTSDRYIKAIRQFVPRDYTDHFSASNQYYKSAEIEQLQSKAVNEIIKYQGSNLFLKALIDFISIPGILLLSFGIIEKQRDFQGPQAPHFATLCRLMIQYSSSEHLVELYSLYPSLQEKSHTDFLEEKFSRLVPNNPLTPLLLQQCIEDFFNSSMFHPPLFYQLWKNIPNSFVLLGTLLLARLNHNPSSISFRLPSFLHHCRDDNRNSFLDFFSSFSHPHTIIKRFKEYDRSYLLDVITPALFSFIFSPLLHFLPAHYREIETTGSLTQDFLSSSWAAILGKDDLYYLGPVTSALRTKIIPFFFVYLNQLRNHCEPQDDERLFQYLYRILLFKFENGEKSDSLPRILSFLPFPYLDSNIISLLLSLVNSERPLCSFPSFLDLMNKVLERGLPALFYSPSLFFDSSIDSNICDSLAITLFKAALEDPKVKNTYNSERFWTALKILVVLGCLYNDTMGTFLGEKFPFFHIALEMIITRQFHSPHNISPPDYSTLVVDVYSQVPPIEMLQQVLRGFNLLEGLHKTLVLSEYFLTIAKAPFSGQWLIPFLHSHLAQGTARPFIQRLVSCLPMIDILRILFEGVTKQQFHFSDELYPSFYVYIRENNKAGEFIHLCLERLTDSIFIQRRCSLLLLRTFFNSSTSTFNTMRSHWIDTHIDGDHDKNWLIYVQNYYPSYWTEFINRAFFVETSVPLLEKYFNMNKQKSPGLFLALCRHLNNPLLGPSFLSLRSLNFVGYIEEFKKHFIARSQILPNDTSESACFHHLFQSLKCESKFSIEKEVLYAFSSFFLHPIPENFLPQAKMKYLKDLGYCLLLLLGIPLTGQTSQCLEIIRWQDDDEKESSFPPSLYIEQFTKNNLISFFWSNFTWQQRTSFAYPGLFFLIFSSLKKKDLFELFEYVFFKPLKTGIVPGGEFLRVFIKYFRHSSHFAAYRSDHLSAVRTHIFFYQKIGLLNVETLLPSSMEVIEIEEDVNEYSEIPQPMKTIDIDIDRIETALITEKLEHLWDALKPVYLCPRTTPLSPLLLAKLRKFLLSHPFQAQFTNVFWAILHLSRAELSPNTQEINALFEMITPLDTDSSFFDSCPSVSSLSLKDSLSPANFLFFCDNAVELVHQPQFLSSFFFSRCRSILSLLFSFLHRLTWEEHRKIVAYLFSTLDKHLNPETVLTYLDYYLHYAPSWSSYTRSIRSDNSKQTFSSFNTFFTYSLHRFAEYLITLNRDAHPLLYTTSLETLVQAGLY